MKANYPKEILSLLQAVHTAHPHQPMLSHLVIALQEYPSIDVVPDKEVVYQLKKYMMEKELDIEIPKIASESEVDKIIREGMDLDNIFMVEEEDEEF